MRELYEAYHPKPDAAALLKHVVAIVDDYAAQGLTLTLRQLYYQLVSKDLIRNEERQYKRVGEMVSRARRSALLDWSAIEDRVRAPQTPPEFENLGALVDAALHSYRLPRLRGQEQYVELWVEKDALAGVLAPIARAHHVTLMVNRGYSSTSAMKESGARVRSECEALGVRNAFVLYLGDLDPSGEDMVRDVAARLDEYVNGGVRIVRNGEGHRAETDEEREARLAPIDVRVEKLALTPEQVEEHDPPPNPAKLTDSRAARFVEEHGENSWEVDALPPRVLRDVIETRLGELIDDDAMQKVIAKENRDKERLRAAVASVRS